VAENTRVRVEPDIETYLKSQSERVLGKEGAKLTGAELTTITNRLLYEHRQLSKVAKQVPFARLFNWLMGVVPGNGNVVTFQSSEQPSLKEAVEDNFDFDADFAAQLDDEIAA
jgi:hypothetical protein